jgi:membrane carboxypeptidase/penicillin-binding protein PbpC
MSYATNRVAYFSNPQIELNNDDVAMGMYQFPTGTSPLGVAENQPKAANAARWMREKAQALASFRRSVSFLYNPASTTAAPGSQATFSTLATVGRTDLGNKDEIQYQWYFNNTLIASATTPTYTLSNVTTANAGEYTVQATSLGGVTIHSTVAILTVSSGLPVISSQPQSTSVAKGGTFTLSSNVSGYNISFQWRKNGTPIAGAIGTSYTKSNATESDAGSYTLTVSNENGSVTSNVATVTVTNNDSGGGGNDGGGGGAPSPWFFATLVIFFTIKLKTRKI